MTDIEKMNKWWTDRFAEMSQDKHRALIYARMSTGLVRAVLAELRPASAALDISGGLVVAEQPCRINSRIKSAIRRCEIHDAELRELLMTMDGMLPMIDSDPNSCKQLELGVVEAADLSISAPLDDLVPDGVPIDPEEEDLEHGQVN